MRGWEFHLKTGIPALMKSNHNYIRQWKHCNYLFYSIKCTYMYTILCNYQLFNTTWPFVWFSLLPPKNRTKLKVVCSVGQWKIKNWYLILIWAILKMFELQILWIFQTVQWMTCYLIITKTTACSTLHTHCYHWYPNVLEFLMVKRTT